MRATPLAKPPLHLLVELRDPAQPEPGAALKRGDGIIAPPNNFDSWQPFPPAEPYPLGPFVWRIEVRL